MATLSFPSRQREQRVRGYADVIAIDHCSLLNGRQELPSLVVRLAFGELITAVDIVELGVRRPVLRIFQKLPT